MDNICNKKMAQIVLCREGKCIDLYYDANETDLDFVECETLKEKRF